MPKINNPTAIPGKMILRYKGPNHALLNQPTKIFNILMGKYIYIKPEIREKLIIETDLFDGTNVCFSLSSANLYTRNLVNNENEWETNEDNCSCFNYVNVDKEQVIFEGSIHFIKKFSQDFSIRENYQVIIIFKNSKDLIDSLDKNNIEYEFHY